MTPADCDEILFWYVWRGRRYPVESAEQVLRSGALEGASYWLEVRSEEAQWSLEEQLRQNA